MSKPLAESPMGVRDFMHTMKWDYRYLMTPTIHRAAMSSVSDVTIFRYHYYNALL